VVTPRGAGRRRVRVIIAVAIALVAAIEILEASERAIAWRPSVGRGGDCSDQRRSNAAFPCRVVI